MRSDQMDDRVAKTMVNELKKIRRELEKINKQAISMGKTTNLTATEIISALDELQKHKEHYDVRKRVFEQ